MNFELLVSWMSHVGTGSWNSFKQSVEQLCPDSVDGAAARAARIALSDLGFADFFIEGTSRWRVLPSRIGSLCVKDSHVFVGGRSSELIRSVQSAAAGRGAPFEVREDRGGPSSVEILCSDADAALIAHESGVEWARCLAEEALGGFTPLSSLLNKAAAEPPKNWSVRSFDAEEQLWVDELLPNAACEYSSHFGDRQYYVHLRRGRFLAAAKRDSIFLGAAVRGVELVEYDGTSLSVPIKAPLPELLARAACCCTGKMSELHEGRIRYGGIPPQIAGAILAALGQRMPQPALLECGNG